MMYEIKFLFFYYLLSGLCCGYVLLENLGCWSGWWLW